MTTWNYRIIHHEDQNGDWYAIHEVYYDKHGNPDRVTSCPSHIMGESLDELREDFDLYALAFKKLPLRYDMFTDGG